MWFSLDLLASDQILSTNTQVSHPRTTLKANKCYGPLNFHILIALCSPRLKITMICCQIVSLLTVSRTRKQLLAGCNEIYRLCHVASCIALISHSRLTSSNIMRVKEKLWYVKNCSPTEVGKLIKNFERKRRKNVNKRRQKWIARNNLLVLTLLFESCDANKWMLINFFPPSLKGN
jgi:hypothetical protein